MPDSLPSTSVLALLGACLGTMLAACTAPAEPSAVSVPLEVEITGYDHHWLTRYPGPDGMLGTADDVGTTDVVRLPTGADVHLKLQSADYAYIFRVPELGLNELAAPVSSADVRLRTGEATEFTVQGDVVCGFPQPDLVTEIRIEPAGEFETWLESLDTWHNPPTTPGPAGLPNG